MKARPPISSVVLIQVTLTLALALAFALGAATKPAQAASRPNIILIMADDMGYECVGANGSTFYKTPNLDCLAAGGIRFEHCYSQPICTPSRVQIMTGRYNHRNYVRFGHLHPGEVTFGNVLKAAGYKTCIAGKWQLQGGFAGPNNFGFDQYCLWQLTRRPTRYPNPGLEINHETVDYSNGEYGPDLVSDYLVEFIKENKRGPFFAYYPMILPHWPFQPTPDSPDWDPRETKEWPRKKWNRRHFSDMVTYTDKLVGKIDRTLRDLGIRDNTLLIFTCDNGTYTGITSPFQGAGYQGGKGTTRNAGNHVPLIVSWPAVAKAGTVNRDLIDFSDLLPTLTEIAGGRLPANRPIDGRSFAPQLRGEKGNPREWTFCWYDRNGGRGKKTLKRYARTKRHKLYHDGRMYDVPNDLLEKHNLNAATLDPSLQSVRTQLQQVLDEMAAHKVEVPLRKPKEKKKKP